MSHRLPALVLAVACALALVVPAPLRAAVTDEDVTKAIEAMRKYFYENQDKGSGNWEALYVRKDNPGGVTALVTLALLVSGESEQRPELRNAIKWLRENKLVGTYSVALGAHVWGQLSDDYGDLLQKDAQWLENTARPDKTFNYGELGNHDAGWYDHSNSQYGLLGLWEAAKRGRRVSGGFWDQVKLHWIKEQHDDGGWSYKGKDDGNSYGSMTCAGLTALFVAQQELYRKSPRPDPEIAKALDKGMDWMEKNFKASENVGKGGWYYYYLYGVERVALASGAKDINGEDWFRGGAEHIIERVKKAENGSCGDATETAFALMFLSRGRVPIWITKLAVPNQAWNNRPNDIYFLTHWLSDQREQELNWQVLDIEKTKPEEWLSAPLAYLASDQDLKLTAESKLAIKRYLDLGGTLLCVPDNNAPNFIRCVNQLAEAIYPDHKMEALKPEHPLFTILHQVPGGGGQQVRAVSNGARDLLILAGRDWGLSYQSDEGNARSAPWKLAANFFVLCTDRGVLDNRLVERFERRTQRDATGAFVIGRAKYEGNWLPEPLAWEPLANNIYNKTGLDIKVTGYENASPGADDPGKKKDKKDKEKEQAARAAADILTLSSIGTTQLKLVWITGVEPYNLTNSEKEAIRQYAQRGGTILIETVGGRGNEAGTFAQKMEEQLRTVFNSGAVPLPGDEAILSGTGLPGGYDNKNVNYRRYTVWNMSVGHRPRLAAFYVNNRPAVLLSHEDLSLGLLNVPRWGIVGYSPESARKMMTNIILYAQKSELDKGGGASAPVAEATTRPAK